MYVLAPKMYILAPKMFYNVNLKVYLLKRYSPSDSFCTFFFWVYTNNQIAFIN